MFIDFIKKERNYIKYEDNNRGNFLGEGIRRNPSTVTIDGVFLIKELKHNHLGISQLCDKGYTIVFDTLSCITKHKGYKEIVCIGCRVDNVYTMNLYDVSNSGTKCLVTYNEDFWLSHRH